MKTLKNYEIVSLGINFPDYFQGFDTSLTSFEKSVVGIGDDTAEAYEDVLDIIASMGIDVSDMPKFEDTKLPFYIIYDEDDIGVYEDYSDYGMSFVYVGIRYNLEM